MEIVIKISESILEKIKQHSVYPYDVDEICLAILSGTPLPKEHGRIGDLDSIMNDINNSINEMTNIGFAVDGQYLWGKLNDAIDNAPTIIEGSESE